MTLEFIDNPANKEKVELISFISDYHKDAYGFRPRNYNFQAWSMDELNTFIDELEVIVKENIAEEEIRLQADISAFKELIEKTISLGAGNIETALRWMFDGSGVELDEQEAAETFAWKNGILFSDYGRLVVKQLNKILYN
jgi:hypothetical protein